MEDAMKSVVTLRLDALMRKRIAAKAKAQRRTLSSQLEHYAYLGMIAEENPDLPLSFIEGILEGREEIRAGLGLPYVRGVIR